MDLGLTPTELARLVYDTLDANGMQEATGGQLALLGGLPARGTRVLLL
jgi:hypothetical protein